MKNIIRSLVFIVAVAAVAGVATYAAYHSEAAVTGVTYTADSMNLKIDSNPLPNDYTWTDGFVVTDPELQALGLNHVKPGSSGEQIFDIKNVSSDVPGNATIKFDETAGSSILADNLIITVYYDDDNNGADNWTEVDHGALSAWNHNTHLLGAVKGDKNDNSGSVLGSMASVRIAWSIPFSAGNNIKGQSISFNTTFGLDQTPAPAP